MNEKERRALLNVVDKKTEMGVGLNNVLTFLVLSVMTWVGVNINSMNDKISMVITKEAVTASNLENLKNRLDRHVNTHQHRLSK